MNDNITIQCEPVKDMPLPAASADERKKPAFAMPPPEPTQIAAEGVRFDFNHGLRVKVPDKGENQAIVSP